MADIVDRSQSAEKYFLQSALRRPSPRGGKSLRECAECGEPIPESRRSAIPGCTLCVDCQREKDIEDENPA